VTGAPLRELN